MWVAGPAAAGDPRRLGRRRREDRAARRRPVPRPPVGDRRRRVNPPFELDNRNKRSVGLNLSLPEGRERRRRAGRRGRRVRHQRPAQRAGARRARLGDRVGPQPAARLRPRHRLRPRRATTPTGPPTTSARSGRAPAWPRRSRPTASRCRTSAAGWATTWPGMAAAGAVAAALFARERTGEGQLVSTSLLRIGMYMLGWDINMSLRLGVPTVPMTVAAPPEPAHQRLRGRRRQAVLDARPPGRPPLARRAARRRPAGVGRRRALRRPHGAVRQLRRARRASSTPSSPPSRSPSGARSSTARTCGGRRCSTPTS